ncbi:MAG: adenylyltransferase/cytidyltransferase family protein [Oscillospiraceae bacterium]|nr:adenylyltransferase/cytidyltransferase family protein [Oscillospiraceae bacterium]
MSDNEIPVNSEKAEQIYGVGLLMGVFDLFHIGHLNLIRRAKARCRYLRIGVLSDALVFEFKQIFPTIPQEERMEILRALRDVDEVVLLEKREDVSRLNEWKKRPFDCFFSGDDYEDDPYWKWERGELRKLGVELVFFPYTRSRSSSGIRAALQNGTKSGR